MSRRAVVVSLPKGVTRVTRRGKDYWYHQENRGKPNAGPRTTLPEYGTPEFWAAIAKISNPKEGAKNTWDDLIELFKTKPEFIGLRKSTQRSYGQALKQIKTAWGPLDPADMTPAYVKALRERFVEMPSMWKMVLVMIRGLMSLAIDEGIRDDNPARDIKLFELKPDEAKPLTEAAWRTLTGNAAPMVMRRYAILARATGQRISDVLRMCPADRDQDGINTTITKLGDRPHWCLLKPDEIAAIDGWGKTDDLGRAPYVLREDGRRFDPDSFREVWREFAATELGAALRGFTPHDLRATKVCDERIAGTSHQQIAAMVGMSIGHVMKYSKHIDQRKAARGTA